MEFVRQSVQTMALSNNWHIYPTHLSGCGLVKRIHCIVTHVQGLSQEQHVNAYNSHCHYSLHMVGLGCFLLNYNELVVQVSFVNCFRLNIVSVYNQVCVCMYVY